MSEQRDYDVQVPLRGYTTYTVTASSAKEALMKFNADEMEFVETADSHFWRTGKARIAKPKTP